MDWTGLDRDWTGLPGFELGFEPFDLTISYTQDGAELNWIGEKTFIRQDLTGPDRTGQDRTGQDRT